MRIFVSNKAKLLGIAVAMVNNFNDVRGKKTLIEIRVFMCHEYNLLGGNPSPLPARLVIRAGAKTLVFLPTPYEKA